MKIVNCTNCGKEFDNEIEGITIGTINGIEIITKHYCSQECQEQDKQ